MRINLPTIEKTYNETTHKIDVIKGSLAVDIDTSFQAHLKWEEQFQGTVGVDLIAYTRRVQSIMADEQSAKANFLSLLKLLYCYINSPKLPTFKEFLALFQPENMEEVLSRITTVLEEVGKTAVKN